jgi:hypothetical protein
VHFHRSAGEVCPLQHASKAQLAGLH